MTDIKTIYEQLLKEESNPKKRTVKSSNENIMTIGPGIDKAVWMCDRGIGPKHRYEVIFPAGKVIEVSTRNIPKSCWCGGRVRVKIFVYQNFMSLIAEGTPIELV
ncbi:hypothetical protein KAT92_06205 [Candidatus Babeliales bacterium]|nr:hypothetical protein [Candidatus Babeliales bacterium]